MTFTLINPQPDVLNVQWDIKHGIKKYLEPLQKKLEEYTELTAKSQHLYNTEIGVKPRKNRRHGYYMLQPADLPHIITPIEAHLGSHGSTNPHLNFILYVPTREQSPLRIIDSSSSLTQKHAVENHITTDDGYYCSMNCLVSWF